MLVFRNDQTGRIHFILLQTIDHLNITYLILKLYFYVSSFTFAG